MRGSDARSGELFSYVDLSMFQVVEGLLYAFPKGAKRALGKSSRTLALHAGVAQHKRVAAYLASERRLPFSQLSRTGSLTVHVRRARSR